MSDKREKVSIYTPVVNSQLEINPELIRKGRRLTGPSFENFPNNSELTVRAENWPGKVRRARTESSRAHHVTTATRKQTGCRRGGEL